MKSQIIDYNKLLTIIIPTKNRPDFIKSRLLFYAKVGFSGNIVIGDSSNEDVSGLTRSLCQKLSKKINIHYMHFPNDDEANTTRKIIENIKTPYAVWVGDDDFLFPHGLRCCVSFLESNKSYHAAHGSAVSCSIYLGKIRINEYFQPRVFGRSATDRLKSYMKNGGDVHYSVHRIESLKSMYRSACNIKEHLMVAGTMPCVMSAMLGNIKALRATTLLRGLHDGRFYAGTLIQRMKNPLWSNSLRNLHDALSEKLVEIDKIKRNESDDIISKLLVKLLFPKTLSILKKITYRLYELKHVIRRYLGLWPEDLKLALNVHESTINGAVVSGGAFFEDCKENI